MVQIFAYFEHMQIVRKLEPAIIFPGDDETSRFFLVHQLFIYDGAPDVPVSMAGTCHHLDGERSMKTSSVKKFKLVQRVSQGCGLNGTENLKIRTSKFYSNGKFEIIRKCAPLKITLCVGYVCVCLVSLSVVV